MGNLLKLNNVSGIPQFTSAVQLYDRRKTNGAGPAGTQIGEARVYTVKPEAQVDIDDPNSTIYDCYLYDVQTYTELEFNRTVSAGELPDLSLIHI